MDFDMADRFWRRSPYFIAMVGEALVVGATVAVGSALVVVSRRVNPPTCSGIGWGCKLDTMSTVVLGGAVIGVLTLATVALVSVLEPLRLVFDIQRVRSWQRRVALVAVVGSGLLGSVSVVSTIRAAI